LDKVLGAQRNGTSLADALSTVIKSEKEEAGRFYLEEEEWEQKRLVKKVVE
jgi:hypothetical protein